MRRSGPLALGLISTPLSACQTPASRRSGPRLARSSGATLVGSVKVSVGIGSIRAPLHEISERLSRRAASANGRQGLHLTVWVRRLVHRFRSSHPIAAYPFANFGIKGALATIDFSAALNLKFLNALAAMG